MTKTATSSEEHAHWKNMCIAKREGPLWRSVSVLEPIRCTEYGVSSLRVPAQIEVLPGEAGTCYGDTCRFNKLHKN